MYVELLGGMIFVRTILVSSLFTTTLMVSTSKTNSKPSNRNFEKNWFKHLEQKFKHEQHLFTTHDCLSEVYFKLQNSSQLLFYLSTLKVRHGFAEHHGPLCPDLFEQSNDSDSVTQIKHVTGVIDVAVEIQNNLMVQYYPDFQEVCGSYHWEFHLHPMNSLNITFHNIYISHEIDVCLFGNITVQSKGPKETDSPPFVYCGFVAEFTVYPPSNNVSVAIMREYLPLGYRLNLTYQIMDRGTVHSQHPSQYNFTTQAVSLATDWFSSAEESVSTFLIQAIRYKRLKLRLGIAEGTSVIVHDGPGFLSDCIQRDQDSSNQENMEPSYHAEREVRYSTSTFVCVVKMTTKHLSHTDNSVTYIATTHISAYVRVMHGQNLTITRYHVERKSNEIHTLVVSAAEDEVNITTHVTYRGPFSTSCLYGGVTIFNEFHNSSSQQNNLCTNTHMETSPTKEKQNMYSKNKTLVLVFCTFSKYSTMSASLSISLTKCRPIDVDVCMLKKFCVEGSPLECSQYLLGITEYSNTKLIFSSHYSESIRLQFHSVTFSLTQKECAILQFRSMNRLSKDLLSQFVKQTSHWQYPDNLYCQSRIIFTPSDISHEQRAIVYHVTGYYQPFQRETHLLLVNSGDYNCYSDDLTSYTQCSEHLLDLNLTRMKWFEGYVHCIPQRLFHFSLTSLTPTYRELLAFGVEVGLLSRSWVDVIIWWNITTGDWQLSNISLVPHSMKLFGQQDAMYILQKTNDIRDMSIGFQIEGEKCSFQIKVHIFLAVEMLKIEKSSQSRGGYDDRETHFTKTVSYSEHFRIPFANHMKKYFSVFGSYVLKGSVRYANTTGVSKNCHVEAFWARNISKLQQIAVTWPEEYHSDSTDVASFSYCLNYSTSGSVRKTPINIRHLLLFYGNIKHRRKSAISWTKSSELCQAAAGVLPTFRDREEFYHLFSFIKSFKFRVPLEAVYIGIQMRKQVCQCLKCNTR